MDHLGHSMGHYSDSTEYPWTPFLFDNTPIPPTEFGQYCIQGDAKMDRIDTPMEHNPLPILTIISHLFSTPKIQIMLTMSTVKGACSARLMRWDPLQRTRILQSTVVRYLFLLTDRTLLRAIFTPKHYKVQARRAASIA